MRKKYASSWLLSFCTVALFVSVLVPRAAAQSDGVVRGQILDVTAKPWADIPIQVVSHEGVKQDTKPDKSGNYSFRNLKAGVYSVFVVLPAPNKPYEVKVQAQSGQEAKADLNFKDIGAKQGAAATEQIKKQEEEKAKFEGMKQHFSAGIALLDQERKAKDDAGKAPADQRDAAKAKVTDLGNQAIAEFTAAQKAASEKDADHHIIWAKLAEAYALD